MHKLTHTHIQQDDFQKNGRMLFTSMDAGKLRYNKFGSEGVWDIWTSKRSKFYDSMAK